MNTEQVRLKYLFEKYFEKTANSEERIELTDLISVEGNKDYVMQLFADLWEKYRGDGIVVSAEKADEMLQNILEKNSSSNIVIPITRQKNLNWRRVAAAAAIFLFIAANGYWLSTSNNKPSKQNPVAKIHANDVNPGSFKARLILADGSNIIIDTAAFGQLAKQGNTIVINRDGQLIYKHTNGDQSIVYNTIATNKGETYSFTLADGSKVWLNSESSVYFPVTFPGKERRINITGEVFVKVAKNSEQPFIVSANGMEVLALGTEFNINSYSNEKNSKTTLIEGMVKVSNGSVNTILKARQQTELYSNGKLSVPKEVNTDEIVAWKEGLFHFESSDLPTILREFARWYDVEVIYEGPVRNRHYFGIIKRSSTLKSVLELLQDNNILFRIEGKKLIVKSG
jgi:ferric-dicitrate binding protein FerR (iron transport regulator)